MSSFEDGMRNRMRELELQIKELEKDRDRLDFLDKLNGGLNAQYRTNYHWQFVTSPNVNRLMIKGVSTQHVDINDIDCFGHKSIRDVIDAEVRDLALGRMAS